MANQTRQKVCRLSSEPSTVINLRSITRFAICMRPVTDMLSVSLQSEHLDCARYFYRSYEIPVFRNKNTMNHLRTLHSPHMCLLATPTRRENPEVGGGMGALTLQPRLPICRLDYQHWSPVRVKMLLITRKISQKNIKHFSKKTTALASTAVTFSRSSYNLEQVCRHRVTTSRKKMVVVWPQPIFGPSLSLRAYKAENEAKTVEIF